MNNFGGFNMRNKRNLLRMHDLTPLEFSIANFSTDAHKKTEMKNAYCDTMIFNNLHLIPDPLKKNLADTVITGDTPIKDTMSFMSELGKQPIKQNTDSSKLAGLTSFFTGFFNTMGAIFYRRPSSPLSQYHDCFESEFDDVMERAVPWQSTKFEDQNINGRAHGLFDKNNECISNLDTDMISDCKTAINNCEEKLNQVRLLLTNKNNLNNCNPNNTHKNNTNKTASSEPVSAEESFEDAFAPEDFENFNTEPYIEYCSLHNNQGVELSETCPMKVKTDIEMMNNESYLQKGRPEDTKHIVRSCEDKMRKIKELLKCKSEKQTNFDDKLTENHVIDNTNVFNNSSDLEETISKDIMFGSEMNNIDIKNTSSNGFDEVHGKFFSSSVESDDSFQIVFTDCPRKRRQSDCDSEDSFIIFDDSPESCYVSHDVFGDTNESSDSEMSDMEDDSGCVSQCKLSPNLSRTMEDLTDDRLYSQDVVDSGMRTGCVLSVCEADMPSLQLNRQQEQKKQLKKVRFSDAPPKVHVMRVWAFAARQARIGHWERAYMDRQRFKRRIADVDVAISWVLKPQHRTRIVFQRFMPWWNAQKRKELAENEEKQCKQNNEELEKSQISKSVQPIEGKITEDTNYVKSISTGPNLIKNKKQYREEINTDAKVQDDEFKQKCNADEIISDNGANTKVKVVNPKKANLFVNQTDTAKNTISVGSQVTDVEHSNKKINTENSFLNGDIHHFDKLKSGALTSSVSGPIDIIFDS